MKEPGLDLSDVPRVAQGDLALPVLQLLNWGYDLFSAYGVQEAELRRVESAVWDQFQCGPQLRVAALLRFRHMLAVLASARLQRVLRQRGGEVLAPAITVSAKMRLNTQWGFSPVKFSLALETLTPTAQGPSQILQFPDVANAGRTRRLRTAA